jgi:hypothetical protein
VTWHRSGIDDERAAVITGVCGQSILFGRIRAGHRDDDFWNFGWTDEGLCLPRGPQARLSMGLSSGLVREHRVLGTFVLNIAQNAKPVRIGHAQAEQDCE